MNYLPQNEQETHLNMTGDDHKFWHVYSDDPVLQRKLESIGAEVTKVMVDGFGKEYRLRSNQVSFRKGESKPLTDEQREVLKERMALARSHSPIGKSQTQDVE